MYTPSFKNDRMQKYHEYLCNGIAKFHGIFKINILNLRRLPDVVVNLISEIVFLK
jgi:hypothetical protein